MAKREEKVAKRYARALFELCPPNTLENVRDALKAFSESLTAHADLRFSLSNPAVPLSRRDSVVRDLAAALLPGNAAFANFLSILLENDRLSICAAIETTFSQMIDQMKNMLALEITSAFPINEDEKSTMLRKIQADYGSMASITWHVDPKILGGLLVKSGDNLLDGSVQGTLERMRQDLLGA